MIFEKEDGIYHLYCCYTFKNLVESHNERLLFISHTKAFGDIKVRGIFGLWTLITEELKFNFEYCPFCGFYFDAKINRNDIVEQSKQFGGNLYKLSFVREKLIEYIPELKKLLSSFA